MNLQKIPQQLLLENLVVPAPLPPNALPHGATENVAVDPSEISNNWVPVSGFDNIYATRNGLLKKLNRKNGYWYIGGGHKNQDGYMVTLLGGKTAFVHRIIARTFIPNTRNLREINHRNGIKADNRVENLEWCTRGYNILHSYRTGLRHGLVGVNNGLNKLSEDKVRQIFSAVKRGETCYKVAKRYSINSKVVSDIVNGIIWTHLNLNDEPRIARDELDSL